MSDSAEKATIKGGWVNVYRNVDADGTMMFGRVHSSREEADTHHLKRIACIQIPDITEGEGL